jgi:hypothetical protein
MSEISLIIYEREIVQDKNGNWVVKQVGVFERIKTRIKNAINYVKLKVFRYE